MSKPRTARLALALIGAVLVSVAPRVRAEEPSDPAPTAPPNAPEAPVAPPGHPAAATAPVPPLLPTATAASGEPTFTTETRRSVWPNTPLLATGATVFGVAYLPAVLGGALSEADGRKDLYIPVAGPWMMMTRGADENRGEKTLLALDGVAQGLGALMLLSSFFIPERATHHWYLIGSNDAFVAPSRVGSGYGMGARGRF